MARGGAANRGSSRVTILEEKCKGVEDCGLCLFICPKRLFESSGRMNQAGYIPPEMTDERKCTGCQSCMLYCPDMAIIVETDEAETGEEAL